MFFVTLFVWWKYSLCKSFNKSLNWRSYSSYSIINVSNRDSNMNITEAVRTLRPNSSYSVTGETYEGIKWCDPDNNIPTKEEVQTKVAELQAEYDALQYQRDREPNYPRLAEQFDLLWHAIDADTLDKTSDFYTTLKAVKDAHPKG